MKFEKEKFNKENAKEQISPKEKELTHEIEQLPLLTEDKINLLLVWRGLKPATDINFIFKEWAPGSPEPVLSPKRKKIRIEEMLQLLGKIGLSAVAEKEIRSEPEFEDDKEKNIRIEINGTESQRVFISSNIETAEELAKNWPNSPSHIESENLGRLFGFPQTTTEAYIKYEKGGYQKENEFVLEKNELPQEIKNKDYIAFARFKLSKENWQEELEIAKKWAAEIQKLSPNLYTEIVRNWKQHGA